MQDNEIIYLASLHPGQWFGFEGEQTYENLWVKDHPKPTLQEIEQGAAALEQDQADKQARREQLKQNLQSRPAHVPKDLADQIEELKEYLGLIDGE